MNITNTLLPLCLLLLAISPLTPEAGIVLNIDTTTNIATLVIDGTDHVSTGQPNPFFVALDFGLLTNSDFNNNNSAFNVITNTAGTGNWGTPVSGRGGAFALATSNSIPIFLHIESRTFVPPGEPIPELTNWAGSVQTTFFNPPIIENGIYTLPVTVGSATTDLTVNVIPEPSSAILLITSAAALGVIRRHQRHDTQSDQRTVSTE